MGNSAKCFQIILVRLNETYETIPGLHEQLKPRFRFQSRVEPPKLYEKIESTSKLYETIETTSNLYEIGGTKSMFYENIVTFMK
jgi:hypothetical protein